MTGEPRRTRERLPLPRHRLLSRDFARVYAEGSRAKCGTMTVCVRANGLDCTRLGLSVGKRCWKNAVKRNRVRRVFREAFRLSLAELPQGLDVVVIASTPRLEPELASTRRDLLAMCAKAHARYREKTGSGA
jgi:ribonuclease P protein component